MAHGVSRQAFYQYQQRQVTERLKQEIVIQLVCQIPPTQGVRKLYQLLKPQFQHLDCQLGRDALFRLLRARGLLSASPKRGHSTTFANHRFHRYPNRIINVVVDRVHQVFVADITYLQTLDGFVYLALVTDLYSRKIVGFNVSDSLSVEGALGALKMAIRPVSTLDGLIHHSDRGVQYCCHAYTQFLHSRGVQLSMTQNGDVYQNATRQRHLENRLSPQSDIINTASHNQCQTEYFYIQHRRLISVWGIKPHKLFITKVATNSR